MNNYRRIIEISKDLQVEFREKITLAESLQIAAQIHQGEVIADGLRVGVCGRNNF